MSEQVPVPLDVLVDLSRTVGSIGVSLARLGSWEAEPSIDERFSTEVYHQFLVDFDVCRKLLAARRILADFIDAHYSADELEAMSEDIEYWEWRPQ